MEWIWEELGRSEVDLKYTAWMTSSKDENVPSQSKK